MVPDSRNDSAGTKRRAVVDDRHSGHPHDPAKIPQSALSTPSGEVAVRQDRVDQLVRAHRVRGHMIAKIDPLDRPRKPQPELDLETYGFSEADLDQPCSSRTISGPDVRTLREIWQRLRNTYCRSIGVQFMHIDDIATRRWLQERMEATENRIQLSRQEQLRILTRLTHAVVFEEFVQKKYVGAKTFSLEGSESLIPLLDLAIEKAGTQGIDEIVIGMAHRGRLNVLANILAKSPQDVFREFEDADPNAHLGAGDVKYHVGYSSDWTTVSGKKIHLSLCFNPSHLEFINPVAIGRMRAKQDRAGDSQRNRGLVLLIHGDAAFAAEGIVQETLNLSELQGFTIGGTIHVIVNNQIGFTTSPADARSSDYASAVAKMLQIPIFHVNGEDPEAVAAVIRLAMDFRAEFKRDVVIDMYGYRRQGHNEHDEPAYTQPLLYDAIRHRKGVREGYLDHLLKLGDVSSAQADKIAKDCADQLEQGLSLARNRDSDTPSGTTTLTGIWNDFVGASEDSVAETQTGVEKETLQDLLRSMAATPESFHLHPRLRKFMDARREMAEGGKPVDWTNAEALAFASLAIEGRRIRLSGQDSQRGTFSQRHSVFHDVETGETYTPLQNLGSDQAVVELVNSPLSEAGVLGFEYGYSLDCPEGLIMWEAQFGDFVNAAQVIIDQFLVSAEDKWRRLSGLVLLLPHGFEGQGPEHSSARLERFLQLAAEDNIQIASPSTPAQYFHLLRRQVLRPWRKPLVVMTPKSLLRHPRVLSSLEDLASGEFQRIIPEDAVDPDRTRRILMCSGKIYYDLLQRREEVFQSDAADQSKISDQSEDPVADPRRAGSTPEANPKSNIAPDIAIIRLEQLYPLRDKAMEAALGRYPPGTPVFWVQEEPENMGAWRYMYHAFGENIFDRYPFFGIYREESASPATGSSSSHKLEQSRLLEQAFADL
jgi:2-oxoglutarate dehydrogenase E1 component